MPPRVGAEGRGFYLAVWAMPPRARTWQSKPAQGQGMDRWAISAAQLETSFARAAVLQREIDRKERLFGRRIQVLAKGLANLMQPREAHHRRGIGLHAFPVDGVLCLAAAHLEEERDGHRYRYAVLCGGEPAKRALNTAELDPGDSDEPGSRRIGLATYDDYFAFVDRLPKFLEDVIRDLETRVRAAESTASTAQRIGRELADRTRAGRATKVKPK